MTCTANGTTKYGPGCFGDGAPSGYSYEGMIGTWTGSATSVEFTATDNQVRMTQVAVTVVLPDDGTPDTPEISGTTPFVGSTTVTITGPEGASIYYTTDGGDPSSEDAIYAGPFTIEETTTVKAIAVAGGKSSEVASKEFVCRAEISTVAEYLALGDNTPFVYTGSLVTIVHHGSYLYAQEENAQGKGVLIYQYDLPAHQKGDVISNFQAKRTNYNGTLEMTEVSGIETATDHATITPVELTPDQVTNAYEFRYVVVKNAEVAAEENNNSTATVGEESVALYTKTLGVSVPEDLTVNYDIYAVVGMHSNKVQLLPIEFVENEPEVVPDLWVIGNVGEYNWNTNGGIKMTYDAQQQQYSAEVTVNGNDYGWFSFTKMLSENDGEWTTINPYRLWAGGNADFEVTSDNQDAIDIEPWPTQGDGYSFKIPAGTYTFIINKAMDQLTVVGDIVEPADPFYIAGSFTNWADGKLAMIYDAANGSYSITIEGIENGAQFKFIDKDDNWYGGESNDNTHVVHPNWCTDIQLTTTGKNFEVNGSGDLTFTVSADKKLTITGWDIEGVTLAEALAGEEGNVLITSDMKVVVSNSNYAIVSDGLGNWLRVLGQNLEQDSYITNLAGLISPEEVNPVMIASSYEPSDAVVVVETSRLDLRTIHRTALTALKPNEVATFVGYYHEGQLCAFSSGSGLHIDMTTDNMVGTISEGKQQAITAVVSLKQAWDAPASNNGPARVAIDDDQAFENIKIDATSASTPTGVDGIKAIDGKEIQGIYNVNGQQVNRADKGVYIIRYTDGTAAKVRF